MKKSRMTDNQILSILKQAEAGTPVTELCREHGMSSASFYKWRAKFGGMDVSMMKRLKELEAENARLKKMYAEEKLKSDIRLEALKGKWQSHLNARRWHKTWCKRAAAASGWPVRSLVSARLAIAIRPSSVTRTCWWQTGCYG